jgi:hypothetical protein
MYPLRGGIMARKYAVKEDGGALVGHVWKAWDGQWVFQRVCALLLGGHRNTKAEAISACIEAWKANDS